jgi:hypothetical protein
MGDFCVVHYFRLAVYEKGVASDLDGHRPALKHRATKDASPNQLVGACGLAVFSPYFISINFCTALRPPASI